MRLEFQKNIASSQFTLPLVSTLVLLMWILLPTADAGNIDIQQHGLWQLLPNILTKGLVGKGLAISLTALAVYLIAELTNANVLLRISSRMLSSVYAFLMGIILCLHIVLPGHLIVIFSILSFFTLFATYQSPSPLLTFVTYLLVSLATLCFPKLLMLIPLYWGIQVYLRSFSLRCFVASIFGTLIPYWILFSILICIDGGVWKFVEMNAYLIDIQMPNYHAMHLVDWLILIYVVVFFVVGFVDFVVNSFQDKTRTRIVFNVIVTHGIFMFIFLLIQPQHFHTLLPLILVDSALVGGHYISQTYNKFSHIYCLVMMALAIALVVVQIVL